MRTLEEEGISDGWVSMRMPTIHVGHVVGLSILPGNMGLDKLVSLGRRVVSNPTWKNPVIMVCGFTPLRYEVTRWVRAWAGVVGGQE